MADNEEKKDEPQKVEETGTLEIRGKPASFTEELFGLDDNGIATDEAGDKIKEIVPQK